MPFRLAPNIDLLYAEAGDIPERVAAAADAGFDAVEFWITSTRDVDAIASVARDRGVAITSILAEPRTNITWPMTDLEAFYDGLKESVDRARTLGSPRVVVSGGTGFMGMKRAPQLEKAIEVLREGVARTEGSGVDFILEPLNTRVDHPGALLDNTFDGIAIARGVGSPRFGVLYDLYHSITEGEDPAAVLADGLDVITYLQLADVPGRGEPGSGEVDWSEVLGKVKTSGYDGVIGLEFFPTKATSEAIERIVEVNRSL